MGLNDQDMQAFSDGFDIHTEVMKRIQRAVDSLPLQRGDVICAELMATLYALDPDRRVDYNESPRLDRHWNYVHKTVRETGLMDGLAELVFVLLSYAQGTLVVAKKQRREGDA